MSIATGLQRAFDAQQTYRVVLDAMAFPGIVKVLNHVPSALPAGLSAATAGVAQTLLDSAVSWHNVDLDPGVGEYLRVHTSSRAADIEYADFIFLTGEAPQYGAELPSSGNLLYPESGATLLIQVACLSLTPTANSLRVTLQGPGIQTSTSFSATPFRPELLESLTRRNAEFPMGLDTILCADNDGFGLPCVVGMPRSAQVSWEVI